MSLLNPDRTSFRTICCPPGSDIPVPAGRRLHPATYPSGNPASAAPRSIVPRYAPEGAMCAASRVATW